MSTSEQGRREAGHQIFDWTRSLGVHRPDGSWAGGVFAALATRLGWDAALVRGLGVIAFFIFFSPMALFYGLAWMFLPDAQGRIHAQQALRGSYPSGFWGAAILGGIGAINVFTPNIVGPFAILLNLVIIGLVAWLLWAIFKGYQKDGGSRQQGASPKAQTSEHAGRPRPGDEQSRRTGAEHSESGQQSSARRADGKPAWYPKEGPDQPEQHVPHASSYRSEGSFGQTGAAARVQAAPKAKPQEDPRVREEKRRRRLVSFGLLLLAIPMIAAAMWFATTIGLAASNAVLLGLAAVVILLALMHLFSAVRGKKGRGGLLGVFTALMLVVFLLAPSSMQDSSHHVFGNYTTQSSTVNTAFANTTVDLRGMSLPESATVDMSDPEDTWLNDGGPFDHRAEINNAFGNTTVILPDDVYVEIEPGTFLGNVNVRMQDWHDSESGISTNMRGGGPGEARGTVELSFTNAFGNITVYDETTYEQEESDR